MSAVVAWFHVEAHRAYTYRVLTALGALAVVLGIVTTDQVQAVALFLGVVLATGGTGLASAKTSTSKDA